MGVNDKIPTSEVVRGERLARIWRRGARLNHLKVRRQLIHLDDIPASAFPVVLELGQGTQFLILREKLDDSGTGAYLVQFPDAREALVRAERLRETYDGTCVFLRPRTARVERKETGPGNESRRGWLAGLRKRIASFPMKRGILAAIICHVLTLAAVLGVMSHGLAFSAADSGSPLVPAMGIFMAAAVVTGILWLRREVLTDRVSVALVDGIFLPLYGSAMVLLAGWVSIPFFWVAAAVIAVLLLSNRLGQMPSRLRELRGYVVSSTFLAGAVASGTLASLGLFPSAAIAGTLVIGSCLINLLIESDVLWQEARLALLTR